VTTELHRQRLDAVLAAIRASGARSVLDLGCGNGDLLLPLVQSVEIERVVGVDLSATALESLRQALARLPAPVAAKASLHHGSMTEPDPGLGCIDLAVLSETIEHVAPDQLSRLESALFRRLRPRGVIVTTPNAEFNPLLGVPAHRFRHPDHRFEWDRARFRAWASGVAARNGYAVAFADLAGAHPVLGGASQMAQFQRSA